MMETDARAGAIVAILVLVGAGLPVAFNLATGALIGSVPAAVESGLDSAAGKRLETVLVVVAVLFVVQEIAAPIRSLASSHLGRRLNLALRERTMRAVLAPPGVSHLEDPTLLDKVNQAREVGPTGVTALSALNGFVGLWTLRLTGALSALIVARAFPLIAVGLVAYWMSVRVSMRRDFLETIKLIVGQTERLRRANYLRNLSLTPLAAKELRVFGLTTWLTTSFGSSWHEVMRDVWRERSEQRAKIGLITAMTAVIYSLVFLYLGRVAVRGGLSVGELSVLATSIFGLSNVAALGNPDYELEYGTAALAAVPELEDELAARGLTAASGDADPGNAPLRDLVFEGVRFHYPGSARRVFDDLSLRIEAGSSLAIVGENGAGKTTLVKLLARLYEPDAGRLLVDGIDVASLDPTAWQRRVAAIFQDFVRYPLSAADNIAAGAMGNADRAAVERAAERAGAADFIATLPSGWDTVLSRLYEGGTELSGGQWQRVALARALVAVGAGAGILVLDEPTANMDVRAEADIYDRFLELTAGLTTIVISHRFSTVRRADRIVVLEHGRIVEDGTHESLLADGGRYAHMFRLQAMRFADDTEQPASA
jgi:ATP-binding cassette subfamily B protein